MRYPQVWNVMLNGKLIRKVSFRPEFDAEFVKNDLVSFDKLDSKIEVIKSK